MRSQEWLKPAIYGALAGAAALAIAGFSWGGWVTGGKAEQIAPDRARLGVVAALSSHEPRTVQPGSGDRHHAGIEARPHQRDCILIDAGWATMPGATDPDSAVARARMQELAARF